METHPTVRINCTAVEMSDTRCLSAVSYSLDGKVRLEMKNPAMHVTKWLSDIPVEAHCTVCPAISFKAQGTGHRPNREEYQKSLQAQFDAHCRALHSRPER